jgi:hypothetical protein
MARTNTLKPRGVGWGCRRIDGTPTWTIDSEAQRAAELERRQAAAEVKRAADRARMAAKLAAERARRTQRPKAPPGTCAHCWVPMGASRYKSCSQCRKLYGRGGKYS